MVAARSAAMPDNNQTNFSRQSWKQVTPLARQKTMTLGDKRIRLLELAPGFEELEWCLRGHIGYVLDGSLEIEFQNGTQKFEPGDVLAVEPGCHHKARRTNQKVTLFVVDED
jgi:mannose-6-phosphate isomerase-like protein (cupin superfamily)